MGESPKKNATSRISKSQFLGYFKADSGRGGMLLRGGIDVRIGNGQGGGGGGWGGQGSVFEKTPLLWESGGLHGDWNKQSQKRNEPFFGKLRGLRERDAAVGAWVGRGKSRKRNRKTSLSHLGGCRRGDWGQVDEGKHGGFEL